MTFFGMAVLTAVATAVLAVFAIVTAWYARRAFFKQSQEVVAIEQQVKDGQQLAGQQAEVLKIQTGQLDVQNRLLDDQAKANAQQVQLLQLQMANLTQSLEDRKRDAEQRRRAQASRVFVKQDINVRPGNPSLVTARVQNMSDQPVYDAELLWRRGSASHGVPNPEPLDTIMPATDATLTREFPEDTNMNVSGAILRFTDAVGVRWIRRPDGHLGEQP
jgi:hypothetical protein